MMHPRLPNHLLQALKMPCDFCEGEPLKEPYVLMLVPKGMSINEIERLAKNPKEGNKLEKGYDFCWPAIRSTHGDTKVENSYWVLMTKKLIKDSRGKSREVQLDLAAKVKGCEAPSVCEASICCVANYVRSGKRIFDSEIDWSVTCCREERIVGYKLVVGGFSPSGLTSYYYLDDYDNVGVAALRK